MKPPLPRRLANRVRALLSGIRTPADAWLAARILSWRLVLPLLKWLLPLPRLVRLMWHGRDRSRNPRREERIILLCRKLSGPAGERLTDNCLERSLVTYRLLSAAGAEPELVVAVAAEQDVQGHVWVTLDGRTLHEDDDPLERFSPLLTFGPEGLSSAGSPGFAASP
jgi:hypothetical protein